ncbi:LysR family transcriptional regulator [Orrella sp. JC864]|uniref:LysR family transcriptional regulator n=1 Tax=Orrella sp. JC864 TaxID=3120298 RepID=UPI0012BCAD8F
MNLRFLETVLWLARLRSIKATADKLCITQTAVSNRISAIEQDLSVRLFERSDEGFMPTPAGLRFLERAQDIVQACHLLRREMLDPGQLRGHVRLGAVSTLVPTVLPALVRTVREDFPHVSLSVTTDLPDRLLREMQAGKLDMLLVSSPPVLGPEFEITPLCSFSMHFVASPALGIDTSRPLTPQELAQHPIIGYPPGSPSQARIDAYFADHAQQTVVIHASATLPTNVQMVAAGVGIAPVPWAAVRREIEQGTLVALPAAKPPVPVHYVAAFAREGQSELPRAVSALARQAAALYCESADPAWAWASQDDDSTQEHP